MYKERLSDGGVDDTINKYDSRERVKGPAQTLLLWLAEEDTEIGKRWQDKERSLNCAWRTRKILISKEKKDYSTQRKRHKVWMAANTKLILEKVTLLSELCVIA